MTMILPVLALLLLSVSIVQAEKPVGRYIDIEHFVTGDGARGLQKVTVIVHKVEDGVFYNTMTVVIAGRMYDTEGQLVGTLKVTLHYTGTMTGIMDADAITGMMIYSMTSTGLLDELSEFGDGHWLIWFENGEVVEQRGWGNLWIP